ncbi:FKBP-type peptidyl-prolyl cis-trans isomerase [Crocinitomicaceae bacterium]|nr:FKBP-type peptidyl-prolyl cis-trans isomerase [Crocinitomicaceae bacterium]
MRYLAITAIFMMLITACETSGMKSNKKNDSGKKPKKVNAQNTAEVIDSNFIDLDAKHEVVDDMVLSNGIKIKWFKHGSGDVIENGQMVNIDYKVYLENGEMIDGNSLRKQKSFPYMVGFKMQPGWDIAMRELRIGDHVEIFMPYQLSRGDKEIEGLIPAKSNNIIKLHILGIQEADQEVDGGTRVWMMNENKNNKTTFGPDKRIYFHCYISTPSNPMYYDTQVENNPFNYGYDEPGLVPGLRKALINAKKADLMLVHVPAAQAYGKQGYLDVVKPNEDLFYRIFVMEVKDK